MKNNLCSLIALGICLVGSCFVYVPLLRSEPIITFFLQPFPLEEWYSDIATALHTPGKVAKHTVFGARNGNTEGILATYNGFLDLSNEYGQMSFPRRHEKPIVSLLFTHKITPIMMAGNTVHHWELEKNIPAIAYRAKRIQDPTTKQFLWQISQIALPANNRVGLETIVIFAKPKNVYVPEGATLASNSPNLILPNIYVKKGAKRTTETLYLLNLKHLFGPIHSLYSRQPNRYSTQLIN